jgi:hypothetical protein
MINSTLTVNAVLTSVPGSTFSVNDSQSTLTNNGTFTNDGALTVGGDGIITNNGTLNNAGRMNILTYGTLNNAGTIDNTTGGIYNEAGVFTGNAMTGNPQPVISTDVITFQVGVNSSQTVSASNSPTSWSSTDLANYGLAIDNSGVISGTPNNTSWGAHSVSIKAENVYGSHTKTITLTISDVSGIMVISPFQTVTDNTISVSAEIDVAYSLFDPNVAGGVINIATGR